MSASRSERIALTNRAVRLAELHETPAFAAARFDSDAQLDGLYAVLPSAFNPPTLAHLGLLELALQEADIDGAAALLSTKNVDKQLFGASLSHRVGMLLELAQSRDWLSVLASNAARIVDQARGLRIDFPGIEWDFVLGYDTLVRLFDPKYYRRMDDALADFFFHHRVIAVNRAPATVQAIADFVDSNHLARRHSGRILIRELDSERAGMSSTVARESIAGGGNAALTPEVHAYIVRHGLYGESSGE
jgi:nicotinic acid mononucleotide adenylyltransferase